MVNSWVLVEIIPVAVLAMAVFWEVHRRKRRKEKPPISEKLLRPPGYSLRRQIEKLDERAMMGLFTTLTIATLSGFLLSRVNTATWRQDAAILAMFAIVVAAGTVVTWRNLIAQRPLRLGLLGEQAVAEQLQTVVSRGYRVFHDLEFEDANHHKWNIDHIAVGPAGVFAIETKYCSKRPSQNELRDQDAVFDGRTIRFPWRDDSKAVEQARLNAKSLGEMLTKATGERVTAVPIVALPGWWVTLKANSDVKVLSGRQLPGFITKSPPRLSPKVIQQIAHQLDQRCRNVEF